MGSFATVVLIIRCKSTKQLECRREGNITDRIIRDVLCDSVFTSVCLVLQIDFIWFGTGPSYTFFIDLQLYG